MTDPAVPVEVPARTVDRRYGPFSDAEELVAAARAIGDMACGTEGQRLSRVFTEGIAAVALTAAYPLIAARIRAEAEDRLAQEERLCHDAMAERDEAEEWADKLAAALGGDAVGEHSSANNPWQNALDIAADHDARVRAEERQRAAGLVQELFRNSHDIDGGDVIELSRRIFAAGSAVPVATPCKAECGKPDDQTCAQWGCRSVATPTEPVTCRHCGHAVHGPVCFNMASDNDCPCRVDTRQPAEQDGKR